MIEVESHSQSKLNNPGPRPLAGLSLLFVPECECVFTTAEVNCFKGANKPDYIVLV